MFQLAIPLPYLYCSSQCSPSAQSRNNRSSSRPEHRAGPNRDYPSFPVQRILQPKRRVCPNGDYLSSQLLCRACPHETTSTPARNVEPGPMETTSDIDLAPVKTTSATRVEPETTTPPERSAYWRTKQALLRGLAARDARNKPVATPARGNTSALHCTVSAPASVVGSEDEVQAYAEMLASAANSDSEAAPEDATIHYEPEYIFQDSEDEAGEGQDADGEATGGQHADDGVSLSVRSSWQGFLPRGLGVSCISGLRNWDTPCPHPAGRPYLRAISASAIQKSCLSPDCSGSLTASSLLCKRQGQEVQGQEG